MTSDLQNLFSGSDPSFYQALQTKLQVPEVNLLSDLEREICILLWMNFDHHEIANLLGIELGDVELERERIREKLHLLQGQTIRNYVQYFLN